MTSEEKDYQPAYTDFDSHPNYYKLLADFSLYDSEGHYAPHKKVAFNMPTTVPYLDTDGSVKHESSEQYIKKELQKELAVRDSLAEALSDTSENGIIPQFKKRITEAKSSPTPSDSAVMQAREVDGQGNSYWLIETERDIFRGITDVNTLQKVAFNFILRGDKGNKIVDIIDGKPLNFIRLSAGEYVYGRNSHTLTEEEYKQKMRISTSIIDLIENATSEYDAPDHKKHKMFPNGFKNYQGRVGIDSTIFIYIVRVGKAKNGMVFYDINLEADGRVPRAKRTSPMKMSASTTKIPQNPSVVKTSDENSSPSDSSVYQPRETREYTDRELLADALDSVATSEEDRKKLTQYKKKVADAETSLTALFRSFGQRKRLLRRQRRSVARSARCRTRSPKLKTASRSSTNSFSNLNRLPLSREFSV